MDAIIELGSTGEDRATVRKALEQIGVRFVYYSKREIREDGGEVSEGRYLVFDLTTNQLIQLGFTLMDLNQRRGEDRAIQLQDWF